MSHADPVQPGAALRVDLEALADDGCGVGRVGQVEVRVAGGAPGDRLRVRVAHRSPHRALAWAEVEAVEARGEGFRVAPCAHAAPTRGRCGGCPLMHLSDEAQRALKAQIVNDALAGLLAAPVRVTPAPRQEGYRNRVNHVVARVDGRLRLGSRAPRSAEVAPMTGCRVARPPIPAVVDALGASLTARAAPVYPDRGGLRYVSVRGAQGADGGATGALVELVVGDEAAPWLAGFIEALAAHPLVLGVATSTNASSGNAIHVAPSTPRAGQATVLEVVGPVTLEATASSFLQLNSEVAGRMYARAAALLEAPRCVLDLYCGAGGLGLSAALAHPGLTLRGAEVHAGAVAFARAAARRHGVEAAFEVVDLRRAALPAAWLAADAALLNPPRRGLDAAVLAALIAGPARQLVYMSCNPASLARDAARLVAGGWRLEGVEAHDMLPQTLHVEALARFAR